MPVHDRRNLPSDMPGSGSVESNNRGFPAFFCPCRSNWFGLERRDEEVKIGVSLDFSSRLVLNLQNGTLTIGN